jgi:hypothetical protein
MFASLSPVVSFIVSDADNAVGCQLFFMLYSKTTQDLMIANN